MNLLTFENASIFNNYHVSDILTVGVKFLREGKN